MSFDLRIRGKSYSGAKSGSISLDIESIANSFTATVTNFWSESITDIKAGDSVDIYVDGSKRFSGWIDNAQPSISGGGNLISISGRSKAGDLVDCTPDANVSEFKNQSFEGLVNALASPFGVSATAKVSTGSAIETVNYEQGETIAEFIRKEAIKKELLLYSDSNGGIVIDNSGTTSSGLQFIDGQNILNATASVDYSQRYSKYIVKGDRPSTMQISEEDATESQAIATDSEIRYRPLIITVDGFADIEICKQRAKWEATIRKGKSVTYSVTVQGFFWNINQTCQLISNRLGANETLLISKIDNRFDQDGGKICNLTLVRPDAYAKQPDLNIEKSSNNPYLNIDEFITG
jgi:prophage tail gpP-like protein